MSVLTQSDAGSSKCTLTIACGAALETSLIPHHAIHLLSHYNVAIRFAITPEAKKFVRRLPLEAISKYSVYHKNGQLCKETKEPYHKLFSASDLVIVYPATPRLLSEIRSGSITCPVTRLVAFTTPSRVMICPALHPNLSLGIYQPILQELQVRGHTVLGAISGVASWNEVEIATQQLLNLQRIDDPPWRFGAT